MQGLRRHDVLGPLIVVLAVYLGAIGVQLQRYDGSDRLRAVRFRGRGKHPASGGCGRPGRLDRLRRPVLLRPRAGTGYQSARAEGVRDVRAPPTADRLPLARVAVLGWWEPGCPALGSARGKRGFAILATAAAAAWLRVHGRSGWLALAVGFNAGRCDDDPARPHRRGRACRCPRRALGLVRTA
jgi:hypothetical protein